MAARGRNQPLQGADPALVQILQMMQNRDANRDNSRKQFLMFPKESFTGEDKKKAKSHWAEFSKYLDYQNQQGTIPRDLAHLPEIKSMFKLTLQDIALGWFETESPKWLTEDQMKQAFLKRFNPWGDTRHQQQDAWNKLKFDMTKDDVDAFVVDMKMLASILGHNDDVITEKFKDIFPDPNIEAALIAMDNFTAMQAKAKQLVQIYKPAHDSPMASAAILVHTDDSSSQSADDDDILQTEVSHVQLPTVGEKYHDNHDDNPLQKMVYGPTYVPYNEDGQKVLLPQTTDMSRKDNLKLLYNSLPKGICDNEYESLEQAVNDVETFQYSHETSTKHVLVQGVYVGSASPLIANIKTQPYSMLTYLDDGMMTGTYDNTHDISIYIDNGSTLNIIPTHFYNNAYYLYHLPKAPMAAKTIHTGNGPVKTHFWIDILPNVQGCMIQFKLLVCDTQAQTGILLSKMALEQLQTWQDYSTNTLYVKQTAIPLHAIQNIELLPNR